MEGIYEPSSDIPLNWSDKRSVFGYKELEFLGMTSGEKHD